MYRGKTKDGKRVKGWYFKAPLTAETWGCDHFSSGVVRHCIADEDGIVFEVIKETVNQYITKDRNGDEIYLASKIRLFDVPNDARNGIVVFDEEEAMFRVDVGTDEYCPFIPKEVEVIHDKLQAELDAANIRVKELEKGAEN